VKSDFSPALNPSVTWIGHATVLVRVGGLNVLTDPQFSARASPVSFAGPKRVVPPAPGLDGLPHIDAVLISHNHYDHLDLDSVKKLAAQPGGSPRFFVPLGLKDWFSRQGIEDAIELGWWQSRSFKGLELHFVPVQHWSKRTLTDENRTLWGGWVLRHPELSFFFSGDAGYSKADLALQFVQRLNRFVKATPVQARVGVDNAPELLARADIISMHSPATESAQRMIREEHFRQMKKTAIYISTGRGPTTDEAALIKALDDGMIAAAGLDVLEKEPPGGNNPLLGMDNVILTAHVASATSRFDPARRRRVGQELSLVLSGRWPMSCVNPSVLAESGLRRWQPVSMERGPNS